MELEFKEAVGLWEDDVSIKIEYAGTKIKIEGEVSHRNIRQLCHIICLNSDKVDYRVLDFMRCSNSTSTALLPLMPIITSQQEYGTKFDVILPEYKKLRDLFLVTNWAHHIVPGEYPATRQGDQHIPALNFGTSSTEDSSDPLDRVLEMILRHLDTDRSTLKAVEWSLSEIMDNVSNHAASRTGGFVQARADKRNNRVEFAIADAGVGIPRRMGRSDDEQAIRDAIDEGVTSDPSTNAGNGLYGSYRVAALSGGRFEISSLHGYLLYDENTGEVTSKREPSSYPGTSVHCIVNLDDPDLLDKALQFGGQSHDPPHDFIERNFESEEGMLLFNMRERARQDFGSRSGGKRVRNLIRNLLQKENTIVIDFSGVGVISSSFADEVFGRLFVLMGPRAFMRRIEMRNVDPTVEGLIDRAILQRTRLGNGDEG